ncbi:MAG: DNA cytosine methyltransferase, partial [Phenylobacterium sp.]|uniref:DNA cytosine methyltransferase n=1 Tax=Phenylobacterium sp. TaxID=1871053 RepID=UPI0027365917
LDDQGRAPRLVVIENVSGLLTSHGGRDFQALCEALSARGYGMGALEIDAAHCLPQSRPRVFVIATREPPSPHLIGDSPFHTRALRAAHARLTPPLQANWIWWRLAAPPARNTELASLLEPDDAVAWHAPARTQRLLDLMAPAHRQRLQQHCAQPARSVGAAYRRMRIEAGVRVQRVEARFDGLAGCLRTPRGGSSRQTIIVIEDGGVRSRLLSPREAARLMGLPDSYVLPRPATAALHVAGDGVAAPVVRLLAQGLLEPLLNGAERLAAE